MATTHVKTTQVLKYMVYPTLADHEAMLRDKCNPKTCRHRVANYRALTNQLRGPVTKVFVDAGSIRFSWGGYRWEARTPKRVKADLIKLDAWTRLPRWKRDNTPAPADLRPYPVAAERGSKILPTPPEYLKKMKERRAKRIARGEPDKRYDKLTLHRRVVGYA